MLIGNGSLIDKIPMTFLGRDWNAQLSPGALVASTSANNFGALAAMPDGHYTPQCWMPPRKAGAMSSRNIVQMGLGATGEAVGGITTDGATGITFTVADAAGQLISSGEGSAAMTFTVADLLLTASLNGAGSTSFSLDTNTPLLGALAGGEGSSSINFSGSLAPYAIGIMVGTTDVVTDVVNANIVAVNGYTVTGTGQTGTEWGPA